MHNRIEKPARLRAERFEARVSAEKKATLQHAAELSGRTLSEFVMESAQAAAVLVIQEHENIRLTQSEQIAFVTTLLNPATPNERLNKAAENYRRQKDA